MTEELRNQLINTIDNLKENEFAEVIDKLASIEAEGYDVFSTDELDDNYTASEIVELDISDFSLGDYYYTEYDGSLYSFDCYKSFFDDIEKIVDDLMDDFEEEELCLMFDLKEVMYNVHYDDYLTDNMSKEAMVDYFNDYGILGYEVVEFMRSYPSMYTKEDCLDILYGETGYRTFDQYHCEVVEDGKYSY